MASRKRVALAAGLLAVIALAAVLAMVNSGGGRGGEGPPRALYYDSLSREYPNPELRDRIVGLLRSHGYLVDVYVNESAGLEPLESLGEYDLVIIRAHGAYNGDPESRRPLGTYIYTGLLLDEAERAYGAGTIERMLRRGDLALGVVPPPGYTGNYTDLPKYVAVSPQFFDARIHRMRPGSIVIFTGCYGMDDDRLASIFTSRGSRAFVGWRGNVTWGIADASLEKYVEALLQAGDPAGALGLLPGELRVDPYTGAELIVYEGG